MSTDHRSNTDDRTGGGFAHWVIIWMVALFMSLPLFIIVYPFVPTIILPFGSGVRIDHVITFALILSAFIILVKRLQLAVYAVLVIGLAWITVTGLIGRYGFGDLYNDYRALLLSLRETNVPLPLMLHELKPFEDAERLHGAIDHQEPMLRGFAVKAATTYFTDVDIRDDEFTLVQCFSVFKTINGAWRYVSDVKDGEYFAKASESAELLAGDCDDHAVLMSACIKAIGGEVRLVRTTGHIYPELKVGDEKHMERAAWLIRDKLFPDQARHATLYYHTDANGDRWLNLDYTRNYPGGVVMDERIEGIMNI